MDLVSEEIAQMACNPHFDQPVTEKKVSASNVRKVYEIARTEKAPKK